MSNSIKAVLHTNQLGKFCELFQLKPTDLTANFDGFHKHILMSADKVFLFPRSPQDAKQLRRELSIYEDFSHLDSVALPKLVQRVKDKNICYYEFGAVTRLEGKAFSAFEGSIDINQLRNFLFNLAKVTAIWHNIPFSELPKLLTATTEENKTAKHITLNNWSKQVLNPKATEQAIDFIFKLLRKVSPAELLHEALPDEAAFKQKCLVIIRELAELKPVLVHADIHEDQILINPEKFAITGVLDWEVARIDNPVWDFNFREWGLKIWNWLDNFASLRRSMWQEYLKDRHITLSTADGLHLFFTLCEITRLVQQRDKTKIAITGTNFDSSIKTYMKYLGDLNAMLSAYPSSVTTLCR